MKKILVILTGGTIGSLKDDVSIRTDSLSACSLIDIFYQTTGKSTEFEVIQPLSILSENMNLKYWTMLTDVLMSVNFEQYSGIIMTHGSDTLSYTSALFGMLLRHTPIPIMITAANYPLQDKRSNGPANFSSCVSYIENGGRAGVFTVYQDIQGNNNVYISTRLSEADPYSDNFAEFGHAIAAEIDKCDQINYSTHIGLSEYNNAILLNNKPDFKNEILILKGYPGLNYDYIDIRKKPAAILHTLYHCGTESTESGNNSLPEFIIRCNQSGIDVYIASCKNISDITYETTAKILSAGAKPLVNISLEAVYAKLLIAYNQHEYHPQEIINQNIYFEHQK